METPAIFTLVTLTMGLNSMPWERATDPWQDTLARPWAPFQYDCVTSMETFHLRVLSKRRFFISINKIVQNCPLTQFKISNCNFVLTQLTSSVWANLNGNLLFSNVLLIDQHIYQDGSVSYGSLPNKNVTKSWTFSVWIVLPPL